MLGLTKRRSGPKWTNISLGRLRHPRSTVILAHSRACASRSGATVTTLDNFQSDPLRAVEGSGPSQSTYGILSGYFIRRLPSWRAAKSVTRARCTSIGEDTQII